LIFQKLWILTSNNEDQFSVQKVLSKSANWVLEEEYIGTSLRNIRFISVSLNLAIVLSAEKKYHLPLL